MKRFNSKRLLAIMLAAIMVFSYLPWNVRAAEDDENTYADEVTIEVGETKELTVPGVAVNEATVEDNTKVTLNSVVGTSGGKELVEVTAVNGFDGSKQYVFVSRRAGTEGGQYTDLAHSVLTNESYTSAAATWIGEMTGLHMNGPVDANCEELWTIAPSGEGYTVMQGEQYLNIGLKSAAMSDTEMVFAMEYDEARGWRVRNGSNYLSEMAATTLEGAFGWNEPDDDGNFWSIYEVVTSNEASTRISITGVAAGETTINVGGLVYKVTVTAPAVDDGHNYDNGFCTDADCGAIYESAVQNADGVYEIFNGGQLYWFAEMVNGGETAANAILMNNIQVNAGTFAADGTYTAADGETVRNWTALGTKDAAYVGTFDGNNKTISGLYLNKTGTTAEDRFVGFISYLGETGSVMNLSIENSYFYGNQYVAAVVAQNKGTVEGCVNSAYVGSSDMICGGVVATNYGAVNNCTNNGVVNSRGTSVGGVVGDSESTGTVTGCSNTGSVTTTSKYAGGIVGNNAGTITGGTNSGAVKAANTAGGIAGHSTANVSGCTNSAAVTADSDLGGIVGMAMCNVTNCSNSGTIGSAASTSTTTGAGGIVGKAGGTSKTDKNVISQCYNTGAVNAKGTAGGIAGQIGGNLSIGNSSTMCYMDIEDCYNTGNVKGVANNAGTLGGIVGSVANADSCVEDCYNTGAVTTTGSYASSIGSIAGKVNTVTSITNCFYQSGCAKDGKNTVQNGVGINKPGTNTSDVADSTTVKTAEQFASGEVAYLLNGSTDEGDLVWKQTLASDTAPKFAGEIVHYNTEAEPPYYNGELVIEHQHNYVNGFCGGEDCDAIYEPAVLVDGVYQIANGGQLYWFAELVNGGEINANAVLTADIKVNENVTAEGEFRAWTPIGNDTVKYAGTFDGGDHTISGLYCDNSTGTYVGLFGYLDTGATVKDTAVNDAYFCGNQYVGTISGYNLGTITGCSSAARVKGTKITTTYVGGITGYSIGEVTFCTNTGTVSGYASVGGMVGYNYGLITDCVNNGSITYEGTMGSKMGGIAGTSAFNRTFQGGIYRCVNTADVTGNKASDGQVGGIVGYLGGNGNHMTPVQECSNSGNVTGYQYVGGLVGYCNIATIENSYNTGTVTAINPRTGEVGGVVGYIIGNATIVNKCYNTGVVSGFKYVGGIIGRDNRERDGGGITDCYYLTDCAKDSNDVAQFGFGNATAGSTTADVEGKTTAKTAEQFASGEVAYLLNGSTDEGELVWKQTLASDTAPKFEGEVVHYNADAEPPYYNGELVVPHEHAYVNGFCDAADCDAPYQAAEQVEGVYQITNGGQLYWFAALVNGGQADADAILMDNITVNENVLVGGALNTEGSFRAWTPIGNLNACYNGTFDGNGKTVSGLYFNDTAADVDYVGLIGYLGGTVKNVTVEASYIAASEYVGGIVGRTTGSAKVEKCTNKATVFGAQYSIGGIVGYSNNTTVVSECVNYGNVSSELSTVGGIVGYNNGGATITKSVNYGKIYAKGGTVGGIVGKNYKSTVEYCINNGSVEGGAAKVGGIAGTNEIMGGALRYSYNLGSVKGDAAYVGALVGYQNMATIDRNYYLSTGSYTDGKDKAQKGVGHKTAGSAANDSALKYVGLTEEGFASGEATYNMNNGSRGSEVWHQTLGTDTYPTYEGTDIVNWGYSTCDTNVPRSYSNEERFSSRPAHEFINYVSNDDATCTADGTKTAKCEHCDVTDTIADEGSIKDHTWSEWEVTKEATYTEEGEETRECSVCEASETRATSVKDLPFVDVADESFYEMPVRWALDNNITNGIDETHFGPLNICNRGQVVTFLWRAAGSPEPTSSENPFEDVPADAFYYKAVLWAVEKGITNGVDATHFAPMSNCNRAQIVAFLWRAAGSPEPTSTENSFEDVQDGAFYYEAVLWAVENGITNGVDETHFAPATECNRAQVVTFLYRANSD